MVDLLIGIEIGGTKLQVVAGPSPEKILVRRRMGVARDDGAARIRAQIAQAVAELRDQAAGRCCAAGVGFGGPVNADSGVIATSNQVQGWAGFALVDWLHELTGLPAVVENDANTAALAEALMGAGRGHRRVFYVTLGSGVGGGMVVDGRLYHGSPPGESEIGLMALNREGHTVESQCSGWAVDGRIRDHVRQEPDSPLARLVRESEPPEARQLRPAIEAGDTGAEAILADWARDMAMALSHVAHLFHPDVVVLGGGLSLAGEPLRRELASALPGFMHPAYAPGPKVLLNQLGEDVVCVGAMILAGEMTGETAVLKGPRP